MNSTKNLSKFGAESSPVKPPDKMEPGFDIFNCSLVRPRAEDSAKGTHAWTPELQKLWHNKHVLFEGSKFVESLVVTA